jgi:hypothetical protein
MMSNREDLLLPVSLVDDDLNQPINLSGTTGSGTFSSWNIVDGAIATTSATPITIPPFPIGNQLSALALTVGAGLATQPGDPGRCDRQKHHDRLRPELCGNHRRPGRANRGDVLTRSDRDPS